MITRPPSYKWGSHCVGIADALELGPLRRTDLELPAEFVERLEQVCPEKKAFQCPAHPSRLLPSEPSRGYRLDDPFRGQF